jgi:hypothetical protein
MAHTASTANGSCEDVVHAVFMGPQGEDGIGVYEVESALKGRFTSGQVRDAIESLVSDGFLYSTSLDIPELDTYRSTDFFLKFRL